MSDNIIKILIVGSGFAAAHCALSLGKSLPKHYQITWLKESDRCGSDILFGGLTTPDAYHTNLSLGITEPELILNTGTTFSFGSRFTNWGEKHLAWVQCFHLPLPNESNTPFHQHLTLHSKELGEYLVSAQAALNGVFAHPPVDNPNAPLSRAEYGYHFCPKEWSKVFENKAPRDSITIISDRINLIDANEEGILQVSTASGQSLKADLYIDCSGTAKILSSNIDDEFNKQREVQVHQEDVQAPHTGPACRLINGNLSGWNATIPLRNKNRNLTLIEPGYSDHHDITRQYSIGHSKQAWRKNCISIGHSAYVPEPVTPAPYTMLSRDIQRLLELVPTTKNWSTERKEYNRRFISDVEHSELFHQALYLQQRDIGYSINEKLKRKMDQFTYHGVVANFDLEPFNTEDWLILHSGLGRRPKYHSPMVDQNEYQDMEHRLNQLQAGLKKLVSQMPPHHIYLDKLTTYLRNNPGRV